MSTASRRASRAVVDYIDHVLPGGRWYLTVLLDGLRAGSETSPLPEAL